MIRLVVAVARACHRHHSCSCSLPTSQLFVLALVVAFLPSSHTCRRPHIATARHRLDLRTSVTHRRRPTSKLVIR
ncbi:hypothetical protein WN943_001988 [Citrus x changshan-huyou]